LIMVLPNLTFFAFKYIPFFDAFRNAYQKAGLYYMFSYFILSPKKIEYYD